MQKATKKKELDKEEQQSVWRAGQATNYSELTEKDRTKNSKSKNRKHSKHCSVVLSRVGERRKSELIEKWRCEGSSSDTSAEGIPGGSLTIKVRKSIKHSKNAIHRFMLTVFRSVVVNVGALRRLRKRSKANKTFKLILLRQSGSIPIDRQRSR